MKTILITIFLFFSIVSEAQEVIQVGCSIFNFKGQLLKKINGINCVFIDDGSTLVVEKDAIKYFDSYMKEKWSHKGFFHHILHYDEQKKQVALLGAYTRKFLNCPKTRFDLLELIEVNNGKRIGKVDLYDYRNIFMSNFKNKSDLKFTDFQKFQFDYTCDTTHINSIYKINFDNLEQREVNFKKGNWLVNISFQNIVAIFDPDFKKLVWYKNLQMPQFQTHDIQMMRDGNFLIYHNDFYKEGDKNFSEILIYDPLNLKVVKTFQVKNKGKQFYKDRTGGVQILADGRKIYSVYDAKFGNELVVESVNGEVILQFAPIYNPLTHFGDNFQDGKIVNLSEYFKNNRSSF